MILDKGYISQTAEQTHSEMLIETVQRVDAGCRDG